MRWARRTCTDGLTTTQTVLIVVGAVVLAGMLMLALLAAMLLPALARTREQARRIRCRNNLHELAKGFATYLNEHGDNRFYPCPLGRGLAADDYNGAEWLASLYWTAVVPDPGVFLCPSSPDTNHNGDDLGTHKAAARAFGSQTVSYAGMHHRSGTLQSRPISQGGRKLVFPGWGGSSEYWIRTDASGRGDAGAIRDDFPPHLPMACDDTEGTVNHGTRRHGGTSVMFFDSHVEFRTSAEFDLERAVGDRRGLLSMLRN